MNKLALKGSLTVLSLSSFCCLPLATSAQTLPPPPPLAVPRRPPVATPPKTSTPSLTTPPPLEVPISSPLSTEGQPSREIPLARPNPPKEEAIREITFQAPSDTSPDVSHPSKPLPTTPTPSATVTPAKAHFYRVEVAATDESILEQVRNIEPFAFFEREHQVVYAGRFSQKDQAQQRVQELTEKGLSAQVVPVNQENGQNRISPR